MLLLFSIKDGFLTRFRAAKIDSIFSLTKIKMTSNVFEDFQESKKCLTEFLCNNIGIDTNQKGRIGYHVFVSEIGGIVHNSIYFEDEDNARQYVKEYQKIKKMEDGELVVGYDSRIIMTPLWLVNKQ